MLSRIIAVCLLLVCLVSASGQQKKQRYVVVPGESSLLMIASQPDCPLRIEEAKRLLNTDVKWDARYLYQLRNQGTKPIIDFTVVAWTSFGTGGTVGHPWEMTGETLLPGQVIPSNEKDYQSQIVPLTDALRNKLELRGPMKEVVVLMVEQVKFADGSTYTDESTSKALISYFEALDSKISQKR